MINRSLWAQVMVGVSSMVIAATLLGLYTRIDSLGVSMAVVQAQLADLRTGKAVYYRRPEAETAQEAIWRTDKDQYETLADHEQRLRKMEGTQ